MVEFPRLKNKKIFKQMKLKNNFKNLRASQMLPNHKKMIKIKQLHKFFCIVSIIILRSQRFYKKIIK